MVQFTLDLLITNYVAHWSWMRCAGVRNNPGWDLPGATSFKRQAWQNL